jgi:cell division protein FtsL
MTYSSSLAMGRQNAFVGRNQNSVAFRSRGRALGPVSNAVILIVLALLLGLLYLTQVTKTNAYGYQISGLLQQQSQLKQQYDNLQVASARLQSESRVQNSSVAKSLTPVTPTATVDQ